VCRKSGNPRRRESGSRSILPEKWLAHDLPQFLGTPAPLMAISSSALASPDAPDPTACLHCGDACESAAVRSARGTFCCHGCEAVYTILERDGLSPFFQCEIRPGLPPRTTPSGSSHFASLDDPDVAARLLEFDDGRMARVTWSVPALHCAACVWLLEQFWRFDPGVLRTEVDLLRHTLRVDFLPAETTLRRIAERLSALGYEPVVTPEHEPSGVPGARRRLYLQLGVAGFAFGNIMTFSIPRYLNGGMLEPQFQQMFNVLNIALAIPVFLFSAADYWRAAWQGIRLRRMSLDIPIALGLAVLFARSVVDIASGRGEGFMDSFSGLVFFLLIGRLFQQTAFDRIVFDRTFRSFFPLSVRLETPDGPAMIPLERLRAGDEIVVRPQEIIPADAVLLDAAGAVDYAFVTGEQTPVAVARGAIVRAGGRVVHRALALRVTREVSHSQLARLWNNPVFRTPKQHWLTEVAARFGGWFTGLAVGLAAIGALAWWPDVAMSLQVATAVLIIACPCALTLAAPITLGTAMGCLGRRGLFLKHAAVVLDLSRVDAIVFDKTGTLTTAAAPMAVEQEGLNDAAWARVRRLAQESVHPSSRAIAVSGAASGTVDDVREYAGEGLAGLVDGQRVVIGRAAFVAAQAGIPVAVGDDRVVACSVGNRVGAVRLSAPLRDGMGEAARALATRHDVSISSGDHDGDAARLRPLVGPRMRFRQSADDKLAAIQAARAAGRHVLMVGDGLNDAGALAAADVGIAVSDQTASIVPACDAVVAGDRLAQLPRYLHYAREARLVIRACFAISIAYNVLGLGLALMGRLTPLVTAILMPVSSLTIVGISTGVMRLLARRLPA
jgi:Cu+-exporting ATPase